MSAFDRPPNFTPAVQYTTSGPRFLRGFQVNPILIARSGLPDTITQNNFNPLADQQRPNAANGDSIYDAARTNEGTGIRYLLAPTDPNFPLVPSGPLFFTGPDNARAWVLPTSIGSLGRNTVREPGEFNIDLSVSRRIMLTENERALDRLARYGERRRKRFLQLAGVRPDHLGQIGALHPARRQIRVLNG